MKALVAIEEATELFRELGDEWGTARPSAITESRARLARLRGRSARLLNEGRARGQALGDDWVVTLSSHYLGSIALRQGDYAPRASSRRRCSSARASWATVTEYRATSTSSPRSRWRSSRPTRHCATCAASIALTHEHGRIGDVAIHAAPAARIDAEQSRPERAVRLYGAASRLDGHAATMPSDDREVHERVRQATTRDAGRSRLRRGVGAGGVVVRGASGEARGLLDGCRRAMLEHALAHERFERGRADHVARGLGLIARLR